MSSKVILTEEVFLGDMMHNSLYCSHALADPRSYVTNMLFKVYW